MYYYKKTVENVKHVIAVSSCKGGVGKSTTSANLALALKHLGYKVGIMDADIYGPSQTLLFGVQDEKFLVDEFNQKLKPLICHGIELSSVGVFAKNAQVMSWKAPMVVSQFEQLLRDVAWGDLDYLVIDLPPGTGDINLRLSETFKIDGVVIVTTPQEIALLDVKKGISLFNKSKTNIFGIIENMSMYVCENCGHVEHIFGQQGAEIIGKEFDLPILGSLPLNPKIRETSDTGKPIVLLDPEHETSKIYIQIAKKITEMITDEQSTRI